MSETLGKIIDIKEIEIHDNIGYEIITSLHNYKLIINNDLTCCETVGYLSCPDDLKQFIGDELIKVEIDKESSIKNTIEDERYAYFVSFYTNKDKFQVSVYNEQNGYYGHYVYLIKDGVVIETEAI